MHKRKLLSAVLAAAMLVSTVQSSHAVYTRQVSGGGMSATGVWIIMGCAGGIILAALAANYRDGRELTAPEAWSCGLLFLASRPNGKKWRNG
jgi:hypothetical protein